MTVRCRSVTDVAAYQLCTGCGACASLYPAAIEMVDTLDHCRRPRIRVGVTVNGEAVDALRVCPGVHLEHDAETTDSGAISTLRAGWGPVLQVWEGFAADPEIRQMGSSGGAATALSLFCLERGGMHGVLHTGARADVPFLNHTVMSRSRDELLARTGSRYAPSSPCDGLQQIADAPGPCVFVGKPCDVAATLKMRRLRPQLDANLGVTMAFFCAGTPSTRGTLDLLASVGVTDPSSVRSLRYRGDGWPGHWTVEYESAEGPATAQLSYEESWGFLQKYRQWRCYLCPDHTGEFADIAVGDPWYREIKPGEPGSSLILARTRRGQDVITRAIAERYLVASAVSPTLLPRSQPNLLKSRGSLWGRLVALRLMGTPAPQFSHLPTLPFWWSELSLAKKVQSIIGTFRRIRRKGLRRPVTVEGMTWDHKS